MEMYQDGVRIYCLPDDAHCKLCGENPLYLSECPAGEDECSGECPYYTEEKDVDEK